MIRFPRNKDGFVVRREIEGGGFAAFASRASESVLRVARLLRVRLPRRALGVGGEEVHRDLVLGAEGGSFEGGSFEGSARHLERGNHDALVPSEEAKALYDNTRAEVNETVAIYERDVLRT